MCINVLKMVWNCASTFTWITNLFIPHTMNIVLCLEVLLWCLWSPSRKQKWSLLIFSPARMSSVIHSSLWAWHCSWRKYPLMTRDNTNAVPDPAVSFFAHYLWHSKVTDVLKLWADNWQFTLHSLILTPHSFHFLNKKHHFPLYSTPLMSTVLIFSCL